MNRQHEEKPTRCVQKRSPGSIRTFILKSSCERAHSSLPSMSQSEKSIEDLKGRIRSIWTWKTVERVAINDVTTLFGASKLYKGERVSKIPHYPWYKLLSQITVRILFLPIRSNEPRGSSPTDQDPSESWVALAPSGKPNRRPIALQNPGADFKNKQISVSQQAGCGYSVLWVENYCFRSFQTEFGGKII